MPISNKAPRPPICPRKLPNGPPSETTLPDKALRNPLVHCCSLPSLNMQHGQQQKHLVHPFFSVKKLSQASLANRTYPVIDVISMC